jgi:hypothetical protein
MIRVGSKIKDSPFLNAMNSVVALMAAAIECVYIRSFETSPIYGA